MDNIHFADQLSAAVKEIFKERGYQVTVSIAEKNPGSDGGLRFTMTPQQGFELNQTLVNSVVQDALTKIGANYQHE